ncbi:MAG: hypothetical protein GY771_11715 [bacterium]|nr:hypothetical protein [bacterium]
MIDLISPIGYGQRGIIGSPPKCGKSTILEHLAKAFISLGKSTVIVLMIAERPEEFTHFTRKVPDATIICSSFDESSARHVKLTALTIEYALRKVEMKQDVVILLDSLTRYVRAVNLMDTVGGKMLTGGLDSSALNKIKRILGAARNLEGYASLTVIATMLINTGSKMDDIIFDESKGTAN